LTAAAEPLSNGPWSLAPGVPIPPYGQPSKFEQKVVRTLSNPKLEPRGSAARTPHHLLNGTITPNGLHFVIARGGETEVDPDRHRLLIHGLVREPMVYTLDALHRYPMVSRISFLECGGNSAPLYSKEPIQANVQALHGLCSCAEWTGVMLSTLFEEVGIDPKAKWFIAEGADLPTMNRSIPLAKALDDAMIALYQNGERLNPANGYPLRLLLPGYEGNMNVKWLRRIKLVESPVMAINETKQYTKAGRKSLAILLPAGGKILHHAPIAGTEYEGARLLRDLRHLLFRKRPHQQGRSLGRRRQELGGSGTPGAGSKQSVHPLPYAMELGWEAGGPAKPRDG
ncbi:MAG: molybdopterin-dependent oxidoreductase, partial [Pseudolabrys sp.]